MFLYNRFMTLVEALILSIVEGLTEFLPISSTGHLVLTADLLGIHQTEFVKSFEIIIQLGAILAVVALYAKTYLKSVKVWRKIILAFIPTGVLGFTLYSFIKDSLLGNTPVTLLALFLGGIVLMLIEKLPIEKETSHDEIGELTDRQALAIGVFQSVAMIPGVSRAASTIIGGLFMGLKRKAAVEFSFLLAVPTMLAATGYDLVKSDFAFSQREWLLLGIGLSGSFVVAILAITFFLKYVKSHSLAVFGAYRVILALLYYIVIV